MYNLWHSIMIFIDRRISLTNIQDIRIRRSYFHCYIIPLCAPWITVLIEFRYRIKQLLLAWYPTRLRLVVYWIDRDIRWLSIGQLLIIPLSFQQSIVLIGGYQMISSTYPVDITWYPLLYDLCSNEQGIIHLSEVCEWNITFIPFMPSTTLTKIGWSRVCL